MSDPRVAFTPATLVRAWKQQGSESLWVRVRAKGPAEELADAAHAAMLAANGTEVSGSQVTSTPAGPVIFVDFCDSAEALETWLAAVARRLEDAGVDGQLVPATYEPSPLDSAPAVALTAALSLPVDWQAVAATREQWLAATPEWYVDKEHTDAVLEQLVGWVLAGPGDAYFSHGTLQVRVSPGSVRELVSDSLQRGPQLSVLSIAGTGDFRRLGFSELGRVVLQVADQSSDWAEQVEDLRRLVVPLAPSLELVVVRRSHAPANTWSQAINNLPPRIPAGLHPGDLLQLVRHLEGTHAPDAYGVQLLTDAHVAQATDLSGWVVEEVAPSRWLVSAPDLAPWYAGDEPDPATLAAAREAFGELILREAHYDATPPTWPRADSLGRLPGSPWLRA